VSEGGFRFDWYINILLHNSHFRETFYANRFFFNIAILEKESLATKLKQDLKEEKQTRKRLESRADHMEEELSDVSHEKESLEKVHCSTHVVAILKSNQPFA
jgi:hypothetical protein